MKLCHAVIMPLKFPIPKEIQKKPFTWAEAKALGVSWNEIQRLLKAGTIERLSRGIYRVTADDIDEEEQFRIATLRAGGESAVCLVSALAHYGLTDAIPRTVWLMVPAEKHLRFTGIKLFRKRSPQFETGVINANGYSITTLERTLAECLTERKRIGSNIAIAAVREATKKKSTSLGKILDMASALKIDKRIRPIIEAMA